MFRYNKDGFLRPYKAIETTLQEFKEEFLWNNHREVLFAMFENYVEFVTKLNPGAFHIWVNGSFTSKKEMPGDIDFVVFLNFDFIKKSKSRLDFLEKRYSRYFDVSYAVEYPENHRYRNVTEILKNQYHELYSTTRKTPEQPIGRPKGYIQLNF